MTSETRLQAQAARVRLGPEGQVAVRPAHGTGDPEREWLWVQTDETGHAAVWLLSNAQVLGWQPMIAVELSEDDDLEPEIAL
jgi:hypothetical protein